MRERFYRNFNEGILWDMELRSILNTDLFQTRNDLFTEYIVLAGSARLLMIPLFHEVGLDEELEFYLHLDLLTYLPFDRLGYDYVSGKPEISDVAAFRYNRIMQIISREHPQVEDGIKENIKTFFDHYYNDVLEVNVVHIAIIALRLFHRYATIMHFGGSLAMMTIQDKIHQHLQQLKKDIQENDLKEVRVSDYVPEFDFVHNELNGDMIEYIEMCLEREG